MPTPAYREVARSGPDHDPEFRVAVQLAASLRPAEGFGRSKRAAEQAAAAAMMAREGVKPERGRWLRPARAGGTRCGFVALIGAPNAGKSTLLNALVGAKISIVTPKVQTTRALIRGIAIEGAAQLIFVDTPGHFRAAPAARPRHGRQRLGQHAGCRRRRAAGRRAKRACEDDEEAILRKLADIRAPKVLVLNKVDLVEKPKLLALTQTINERAAFAATFMVSARSSDGVADLKSFFAAHVPAGPWLYPEDQISDAPLRQLAAEITREKLYLRLHQELPYQSTVETEAWKELRDGAVRIEQTIYVERESQRKIVLGKGGQTIKAIGAAARADIAAAIEHAGASVPVRQGARGLGRRSGALPRDGAGVPTGVTSSFRGVATRRARNT